MQGESERKMDRATKRIEADKILLRNDLNRDQKMFVISQLYKDEINSQFPQLHYALLGWKDAHLKELWSKEVIDCLESFGDKII